MTNCSFFEYDGAYKCKTCGYQCGALPGKPCPQKEISRLQEENIKLRKRVEIVSKGDFPNLDI